VLADYERAVEDEDPKARIVLEVVAKLDGEREAIAKKVTDTEAVAAEWEDTDDGGLRTPSTCCASSARPTPPRP
jgi:hypothetical protein